MAVTHSMVGVLLDVIAKFGPWANNWDSVSVNGILEGLTTHLFLKSVPGSEDSPVVLVLVFLDAETGTDDSCPPCLMYGWPPLISMAQLL